MSKLGAQTSMKNSLNVGQWKKIQKAWPQKKLSKSYELTWLIQMLLIQK